MNEDRLWSLQEEDLKDVTPQKALTLIIDCFYTAQKETYARVKKEMGLVVNSDKELYNNVYASFSLIFRELGADFKNPTKDNLLEVVDILAERSSSWGTPEEIIEHHKKEVKKLLDALE